MRSNNNNNNNNNNGTNIQNAPTTLSTESNATINNNNNNNNDSKLAKPSQQQQKEKIQPVTITDEEKKKKERNDKLRNREEELVRLAKLDLDRMDFSLRIKKGDRAKGPSAERVGEAVIGLIQERTEEKVLNALKELERYESGPLQSCIIISNTCAIEEIQLEALKKRYKESNESTVSFFIIFVFLYF